MQIPATKDIVKFGGIAAALTAILVFTTGYIRPVMQSDPFPLAGVPRVTMLQTTFAQNLDTLQKTEAIILKKQHRDELRSNNRDRDSLVRDIMQIQDELKHHPNDPALLHALAADQSDLQDLIDEHHALLKD